MTDELIDWTEEPPMPYGTVERVYVVVDQQLSRGAQTAQSIHAVVELKREHPEAFANWHDGHNVIIVLEAYNIQTWKTWLKKKGIHPSCFCEPDFGGEYRDRFTAFAVLDSPEARDVLQFLALQASNPSSKREERRRQRRESALRAKWGPIHEASQAYLQELIAKGHFKRMAESPWSKRYKEN